MHYICSKYNIYAVISTPLMGYIVTNRNTSSNCLHVPKHASLISVLSVLWMIFTTNITANGVRNEIACEKIKTKSAQLLLEMHCGVPQGPFCRLIVKWLLPRGMTPTYPLFRVHFNKANGGAKQASLLFSGVSCLHREEFCSSLDKRFGPSQQVGNYSCLRLYSLLSGQIQYIFFATEVVKTVSVPLL